MKGSTLAYLSKHMKSADLHAIADKHAASGNQTSERSVRRMAKAVAQKERGADDAKTASQALRRGWGAKGTQLGRLAKAKKKQKSSAWVGPRVGRRVDTANCGGGNPQYDPKGI
jgi:hypothetical protein